MARNPSAMKYHRQAQKARAQNRAAKSTIRTFGKKAAAAAEKERDALAQRLSNPNFTERAKPEAVEKARSDHESKSAEAERLRAALERLG